MRNRDKGRGYAVMPPNGQRKWDSTNGQCILQLIKVGTCLMYNWKFSVFIAKRLRDFPQHLGHPPVSGRLLEDIEIKLMPQPQFVKLPAGATRGP